MTLLCFRFHHCCLNIRRGGKAEKNIGYIIRSLESDMKEMFPLKLADCRNASAIRWHVTYVECVCYTVGAVWRSIDSPKLFKSHNCGSFAFLCLF